jgi:hypothetical protein
VSDLQQVSGFLRVLRINPVSSTNKTDHHDITEIVLKVALNTINQAKPKRQLVATSSDEKMIAWVVVNPTTIRSRPGQTLSCLLCIKSVASLYPYHGFFLITQHLGNKWTKQLSTPCCAFLSRWLFIS